MKIRIKGNTLRIRVTKSEVAYLSENRCIEESIDFGKSKLTYGLKFTNTETILADFFDNQIMICIPLVMGNQWTATEQVSLSEEMPLKDGKKLFILIEKDFKCLDETSEDQSDNYNNPLAEKLK